MLHKNKMHKKSTALLVSLILLLCVTVGGTIAFIIDVTDPVTNIFTSSEVTTKVDESFDGEVKQNVRITNTGDTEAYIRAAVVVTWQDASGNVYGKAPVASEDYAIEYNLSEGWKLSPNDGFYYWTEPVAGVVESNGKKEYTSTGALIKTCTPIADRAPAGYSLNVEIIGSGIQSKPHRVVLENWSSGVSGFVEEQPGKETDTLIIKQTISGGSGQ